MVPSNDSWFSLPTKKELDEKGFSSTPLEAEDYIVKIQKIILQKEPTWNNEIKRFDYDNMSLQYTLVCLPYKPKSEDELKDIEGNTVKPLSMWIFRRVNPFSIGFTLQGEPSYMRSLIAYLQGMKPNPNEMIAPPAAVVVNKTTHEFATEEETAEYKKQYLALKNGELKPKDFTMGKDFEALPDIREFEGKYIGAKIIADENGRNKIVAFGSLPSSFSANASVEEEALKDFDERWEKYLENRKKDTKPDRKAASKSEKISDEEITDEGVEF